MEALGDACSLPPSSGPVPQEVIIEQRPEQKQSNMDDHTTAHLGFHINGQPCCSSFLSLPASCLTSLASSHALLHKAPFSKTPQILSLPCLWFGAVHPNKGRATVLRPKGQDVASAPPPLSVGDFSALPVVPLTPCRLVPSPLLPVHSALGVFRLVHGK